MKLTQEMLDKCISYSDICRMLHIPINGNYVKKARRLCNGLSTKHFGRKRKYPIKIRICPVCKKEFSTTDYANKKPKITCGYACSNTYFRSGENNGSWKGEKSSRYYRRTALSSLPLVCFQCGYNKHIEILEVHHVDGQHKNSKLDNLRMVCPTCHDELHFISKTGKWAKKSKPAAPLN